MDLQSLKHSEACSQGQAACETYALFSTPLWVANCPDASTLNPLLRNSVIAAMEAEAGASLVKRSNRRGWRSPPFSLEAISLWAPLAGFVRQVLASILDESLDYELNSSGVNVHLEGGFNVSHVHPNAIVSGVYYIACPLGGGDLVFEDPRVQAVFASSYPLFRQDQGASKVVLTPHAGQLVLFPSWLSHRVEPSASFEPRISLPINVMLCGLTNLAACEHPSAGRDRAGDGSPASRPWRGFGAS